MGEWKLKKVAEIAEVIGGGTPKTKKEEYWGGDIPWLTPKDLSGEHPRAATVNTLVLICPHMLLYTGLCGYFSGRKWNDERALGVD